MMAAANTILLDGKELDVSATRATTEVAVETSVEQSSTVTISIRDNHKVIIDSGLLDSDEDGRLDRTIQCEVGPDTYRLAAINKAGNTLALTCENELIAQMRVPHGALKPRAGTTDVELVVLLAAEMGVDVIAPTHEPVQAPKSQLKAKTERSKADTTREPGISDSTGLTVGGKPMRAEQRRVADSALSTAFSLGDHPKAILALAEACIVEPGDVLTDGFTNPSKAGDHGSKGLLQLTPETARSTGINPNDVVAVVKRFMNGPAFTGGPDGAIALARKHPDWSAGRIAQTIQGSQFPARYDQQAAEARKIIAAYQGGGGTTGGQQTNAGVTAGSSGGGSLIARGPNENTWQCFTRLASEHGKRCFVVGQRLYYISEANLMASRPVAEFTERHDGVDWIDWEWMPNKQVNTATVACRIGEFEPSAGAVVTLADCGPANGRWLISSVSRTMFRLSATITLRRGTELLKQQDPKAASEASSATSVATPGATSGTGRTGSTGGSWKYAAGVPNTLNSKMRPFIDRMATFYDGSIVVTTTTNHSYLTTSGNVSDHNGGGAADMGMVANGGTNDGPVGFKLAIAAYRACGLSYGAARAKANVPSFTRVPCKEGSAQILWRVEGHHDHVHVGVH